MADDPTSGEHLLRIPQGEGEHFDMNANGRSLAGTGAPLPRSASSAAELVERDAWLDFFDAARPDVRRALGLASTSIAGKGLLACRSLPLTELNRAIAAGVEQQASDQDLDAAVAWLDQHAAPSWALQVAPFTQARSVEQAAARHGLAPAGSGWAKLVRAAAPLPAPATTAEVIAVEAQAAGTFGQTVRSGFGLPEEMAPWFAALVGRPRWSCFLALIDGEPAGGAAVFVQDGAAWLGMDATHAAFGSYGAQGSLIARRINVAAESGATLLTCETGMPAVDGEAGFSSFRNMKRAGFDLAYVRPNLMRAS